MIVTYVDFKGNPVENFPPGMDYKAIAKKVVGDELTRYYICRANGRLVDARKLSPRQLKNSLRQWVPVNENVFEMYIKYTVGTTKTPLTSIERLI